jgi:hypothetical protein
MISIDGPLSVTAILVRKVALLPLKELLVSSTSKTLNVTPKFAW